MNYFYTKSISILSSVVFVCITCFFSQCMLEDSEKFENIEITDVDTTSSAIVSPKRGEFYETELTDTSAFVIANTVTYDVVIKNPNSEDTWTEECLKNIDSKTLIDKIFKAVYDGRIKAYTIHDELLSIEDVKALEKEKGKQRDKVGKIQFIEEWYFDEENFKMGKKVNFLMLGYENYNTEGEVRNYKAGIKVKLN